MTGGPASVLLSVLDWTVVAVYVGGLVVLGLLLSRKHFAPVDFFLASRATQWPVIGLALLASNMSSTALVGLAGGAYALGVSVYDYEWTAAVILVFFCLFLLPFVIRSGTYTMPEFLERRYDARVRLLFALLTLFLNVFVDSAGILYSGSLVCQLLFPEQPLWLIVLVLAGAAGVYTVLGGLRAVIYTEAVQGIVLMAGALVISVGAFSRAGGWHAVMSGVDPAAVSLIRPIGDPGVPWPGLLLGIPLLGFYYWCTNQTMVQRLLSAKNVDHARWGALFAGLLKLPVLFLIVLPGTCALLLFPKLPRADMVYPKLILNLLPPGLIGLVVAGFVAATMVSIASMLNSASTLLTIDVIRQFRPRLSNSRRSRVCRTPRRRGVPGRNVLAWSECGRRGGRDDRRLDLRIYFFSAERGPRLDAYPFSLRGADPDFARPHYPYRGERRPSGCGKRPGRRDHVETRLSACRAAETCSRSLLAGLPGAGSRVARADGGRRHRLQMKNSRAPFMRDRPSSMCDRLSSSAADES
jgi:SSS family transporter